MNIVVCIKQVLDPLAPVSSFRIDTEARRAVPPAGTPPVLNPFDENALEAALKIRDASGASIAAVSVGSQLAKPVLKKALAAGADQLFLVDDPILVDLDSYSTALALAGAVSKIGDYDVIVCGRQSSDTDAGQVGPGLAELLGLPCVTLVTRIEKAEDGRLRVERLAEDGREVVEVATPVLLTVSNEMGELRYAALKEMIAANKKPITVWRAADLDPNGFSGTAKIRTVDLFIPVRESVCEMVGGTSPEETVENLISKLRAARAI